MAYLSCVPYLILNKRCYKKKVIYQKIVNSPEFEKGDKLEQEIDLIINSIVFLKKTIDIKLLRLYYLIYKKVKCKQKIRKNKLKKLFIYINHLKKNI